MTQTTITTTPDQHQSQPAKANNAGRCIFRYPRGRCKLPAISPQSSYCLQHASAAEPHDTDDLSMDLFGEAPLTKLPALHTPEEISDFLTRVIVLLAQGRITPRRATVLTYASSLSSAAPSSSNNMSSPKSSSTLPVHIPPMIRHLPSPRNLPQS
jgi:hypothetical protein